MLIWLSLLAYAWNVVSSYRSIRPYMRQEDLCNGLPTLFWCDDPRNSFAANLASKRELLSDDVSTHAGISHSRSLRCTVACVIVLVCQPRTGDGLRSLHVRYLQPSSSLITFLLPPAAASSVAVCVFALGTCSLRIRDWRPEVQLQCLNS